MEKKPCVRCERLIDPVARICPFCNWDQEIAAPPQEPVTAESVRDDARDAATEERRQRQKRILVAAGIVALLIATFAIGSFVSRLGRKPATPQEETPSGAAQTPLRERTQLTDLRLVPVDLTSTVGGSMTSAPHAPGTATDAGGHSSPDATALPSQQYSELVRRSARQPSPAATGLDTLDPRTIVAPPIPQIRRPAPAPQPAPQQTVPSPSPSREVESRSERTRPEPLAQPIPDLDVEGTARFRLVITSDGRVSEVDVLQTIPGATPQLISALRRWRFKSATENGRPVEGVHLVDISFKGRDD